MQRLKAAVGICYRNKDHVTYNVRDSPNQPQNAKIKPLLRRNGYTTTAAANKPTANEDQSVLTALQKPTLWIRTCKADRCLYHPDGN